MLLKNLPLLACFVIAILSYLTAAENNWGVPVRKDHKNRRHLPPKAKDFDEMMELAASLDGLGLDTDGLGLENLFDTNALTNLEQGFESFTSFLESADFTKLATPESIKEFLESNPMFQSLSNMDEIKEFLQSPDFNDPAKLQEAMRQSTELFKELYREIMSIISDKTRLKTFVDELLADMDPSMKVLLKQLLWADSDGLARLVKQTIADVRTVLNDDTQLEDLRKLVLRDNSLMNLLGNEAKEFIQDPKKWRHAIQSNANAVFDSINQEKEDTDAWRRA